MVMFNMLNMVVLLVAANRVLGGGTKEKGEIINQSAACAGKRTLLSRDWCFALDLSFSWPIN